jgi:hypothetical protein
MLQSVNSSKTRVARNMIQVQSYQDKYSQEYSTKATERRSSQTRRIKKMILILLNVEVARQGSSEIGY